MGVFRDLQQLISDPRLPNRSWGTQELVEYQITQQLMHIKGYPTALGIRNSSLHIWRSHSSSLHIQGYPTTPAVGNTSLRICRYPNACLISNINPTDLSVRDSSWHMPRAAYSKITQQLSVYATARCLSKITQQHCGWSCYGHMGTLQLLNAFSRFLQFVMFTPYNNAAVLLTL